MDIFTLGLNEDKILKVIKDSMNKGIQLVESEYDRILKENLDSVEEFKSTFSFDKFSKLILNHSSKSADHIFNLLKLFLENQEKYDIDNISLIKNESFSLAKIDQLKMEKAEEKNQNNEFSIILKNQNFESELYKDEKIMYLINNLVKHQFHQMKKKQIEFNFNNEDISKKLADCLEKQQKIEEKNKIEMQNLENRFIEKINSLKKCLQKTKKKLKKNKQDLAELKKESIKNTKSNQEESLFHSSNDEPSNLEEIQVIKKEKLQIQFEIFFPYYNNDFGIGLLKYMQIFEDEGKNINFEGLTNFLDNLLSARMSCEIPDSKVCDLVPTIHKEDKFGQWKYDYLFGLMKITAKFKDENRKFPPFWKVEKDDNSFYDINVIEAKKSEMFPTIDLNMPIKEFFLLISKRTSKNYISQKIFNEFKKDDVKNVRDLINIKQTSPEVFSKFYSIKFEILEALNNVNASGNIQGGPDNIITDDFFKEENKKVEYQSKSHNVLRYFYFVQNKHTELSYLYEKFVDKAHKCIKEKFSNEDLLIKVKNAYKPMTLPNKVMKNLKMPRGILFYGPPGTGKTTVAVLFPDLMGLTPICPPLASTELNRSLVGETEALITQICERAHNYKHLICYISVDEIDAMVPRRDDKENKNKGDTVNTLLSLICGTKDVPNLVFIASTNFKNKIDEAFSRRMSCKFFVGRMNGEERQSFINKKLNESFKTKDLLQEEIKRMEINLKTKRSFGSCIHASEEEKINEYKKMLKKEKKLKNIDEAKEFHKIAELNLLSSLNVTLINFTPAALEFMNTLIIAKIIEDSNHKFKLTDLLEAAATSAKQMNIKLGSYYVPEIYLNLKLYENKMENISFSSKIDSATGLVLIDLNQRKFNIAAEIIKNNSKKAKFIEEPIKDKGILTGVNDIIDQIAKFAEDNKIHAMELIDFPSLVNNQAFDDQKTFEVINDKIIEMSEYPSSLLVFDLDSLISTNISESNSSMGPNTSVSVSNMKIFSYIRDISKSKPKVNYDEKNKITEAFWIFLVSHDEYLIKLIKKELHIDLSTEEENRIKKIEEEERKQYECCRCAKKFHKKDNKSIDVCQYHIGYLFDSSKSSDEWELLDWYNKEDKMIIEMASIQPEKRKYKNSDNESDNQNSDSESEYEDEQDQNPYVYICCKKRFNDQACLNNYHLEEQNKSKFQEERLKQKWNSELEIYKNHLVSKND